MTALRWILSTVFGSVIAIPSIGIATAQTVPSWFDAKKVDTRVAPSDIRMIGECVVAHDGASWIRVFAPAPATERDGSEVVVACVRALMGGRSYAVPHSILRGSIAEAFYLENFEEIPALNTLAFYLPPGQLGPEGHRARMTFMDCVLQANPAQVDQLIRTRPGSRDEKVIAQRVAATGAACEYEDGEVLGIEGLRYGLADVLFRRSLPEEELTSATPRGANK